MAVLLHHAQEFELFPYIEQRCQGILSKETVIKYPFEKDRTSYDVEAELWDALLAINEGSDEMEKGKRGGNRQDTYLRARINSAS